MKPRAGYDFDTDDITPAPVGVATSNNDSDDEITPPPSPPDHIGLIKKEQKRKVLEKAFNRLKKYEEGIKHE